MNMDQQILASVFIARLDLARQDLHETLEEATKEWHSNHLWLRSDATGSGTFLWYCDQLGLDPTAVRKSIGIK